MLPRDENSLLRSKCAELEETYSNLRARCFAMESMTSTQPSSSSLCKSSHMYMHPHDARLSNTSLDLPTYMCNNPNPGYQPQRARTATSTTRTRTGDRRVAKENQDLITSLYRRNEEIMRDYSILRNKHQNVLSNNGKLKKEVQSLRLRASANYRPRTSIFPTSSSFARTGATMRIARDASNHCAKRRQTPRPYDDDVDGAKGTDSLSEALASTNTDKFMEAERRHLPSDPPIFATKDPTGVVAFPVISCSPSDHHLQSHESLVKELAEATSKLYSLKEKYEKLNSTCNECLDTLQETKHEFKVTRKAKELLEEEVSELRSQNASLEEKVTQFCCDAPITSIRLPSAAAEPTTASSVADPFSTTTTASPTDESKEGKDRDSAGSDSRAEIIHKKAASAAEEAASAAEEAASAEEEAQDRGQESSKLGAPEATDTASPARATEDEAIHTNKGTPMDSAPSSKVAENIDVESQSSYQDEAFDEYADDTFED